MKQSRRFVRSCSDGKQHISEGSKTTEQCVYKCQIPEWMLQHIQQTQRNTVGTDKSAQNNVESDSGGRGKRGLTGTNKSAQNNVESDSGGRGRGA